MNRPFVLEFAPYVDDEARNDPEVIALKERAQVQIDREVWFAEVSAALGDNPAAWEAFMVEARKLVDRSTVANDAQPDLPGLDTSQASKSK